MGLAGFPAEGLPSLKSKCQLGWISPKGSVGESAFEAIQIFGKIQLFAAVGLKFHILTSRKAENFLGPTVSL